MADGKPQKTKVVIAGITIKDDDSTESYLLSWSRNETLGGDTIKEITLVCPRSIENILTLNDTTLIGNTKEVVITRGETTSTDEIIFRGIIKNYNIFGGMVTFTCADKLYITTKNKINYSYDKDVDPSAGVISDIFLDMINTYTTLTADATSVQDSGTILTRDKVICKSDSVYNKIISELTIPLNWNTYYNSVTNLVNFEPKGYTNNSTIIEVGTNVLQAPNWKSDESNIYNYIEIQGAEQEISTIETGRIGTTSGYNTSSIQLLQIPNTVRILCDSATPPTTEKIGGVKDSTSTYDYTVDATKKQIIWNTTTFTPGAADYVIIEYTFNRPTPIVVSDPISISTYGTKDVTIIKSDLKSVSDARLYASALLGDYKEPILSTTLKVTNIEDLRVGQKVQVIDSDNSINQFFYITNLKQSYPYNYDQLNVVSEILDVNDGFYVFVIRKLMQLDRASKDDFDFLIEIQSFENNTIYENRYNKISSTSITGTTGIFDSAAFGIWDTATFYDPTDLPFILGHATYGIIGTSTLGDGSFVTTAIYMENSAKKFVELFYDEDFKDASTTADWDTTNNWVEITSAEIAVSELFAYDFNNDSDNAYKSVTISMTGTALDDLTFYVGEFDGINTTYSAVTFTGTATSKTGTLYITNKNKYGLNWKAEYDSSTSVITKLVIDYTK